MTKSRVFNRFHRWTPRKKITLPWSFRGRVGVSQCRAGELAVQADGLVLPAVAATTAISATVTIAAAAAAISAAATIATAAAIAPTPTAATTTTFTGSGFVDTNHAPHPFDVLKVVNGLLFGRIVGQLDKGEAPLATGFPVKGQAALAHLSVLAEEIKQVLTFGLERKIANVDSH